MIYNARATTSTWFVLFFLFLTICRYYQPSSFMTVGFFASFSTSCLVCVHPLFCLSPHPSVCLSFNNFCSSIYSETSGQIFVDSLFLLLPSQSQMTSFNVWQKNRSRDKKKQFSRLFIALPEKAPEGLWQKQAILFLYSTY